MKKISKALGLLLVLTLLVTMSVMLAACNKANDDNKDVTVAYTMTADEVTSILTLNTTKSTFTVKTGTSTIEGKYTAAIKGYANLFYSALTDGVAENLYTTVSLTAAEGGNTYAVVSTANADDDYGTRTVVDKSGTSVTITGEVDSIINLWPAGTGSFYAIGAADLLVGTAISSANDWTSFFNQGAADITVLGGVNPSVEAIAALNPDLVIVHPSNAATLQPNLAAVGIPSININFSDYDSMKASYKILGTVLGGRFKAKLDAWCLEVDEDLAFVRGLTENLTENQKPVVYYISGQGYSSDAALLTTTFSGSGTTNIMKDWCESAGGKWASTLMNLSNTAATAEAVLALNPDIILCGGAYQHVAVARLGSVDGWKDLAAVVNGKVYTDPYVCFNWDRFGLESLMQIKYALKVIHPELCTGDNAVNMLQEVKDFYLKYTEVTLTDTQAQYILDGKTPTGQLFHADSI